MGGRNMCFFGDDDEGKDGQGLFTNTVDCWQLLRAIVRLLRLAGVGRV